MCFIGHPIALVVARTAHQARQARELIEVEIDDLPVVVDPREGFANGDLIHPPRTMAMGDRRRRLGGVRRGGGGELRDRRAGAPLPGDAARACRPQGGRRDAGVFLHPGAGRGAARDGGGARPADAQDRGGREAARRRLRRQGGPGHSLGGAGRAGRRAPGGAGGAGAEPARRHQDDREAPPLLRRLQDRADHSRQDPRLRGHLLPELRRLRRPLPPGAGAHAVPRHQRLLHPQRAGDRGPVPHQPAAPHRVPRLRRSAGDVRDRGRDQQGRRRDGDRGRRDPARQPAARRRPVSLWAGGGTVPRRADLGRAGGGVRGRPDPAGGWRNSIGTTSRSKRAVR